MEYRDLGKTGLKASIIGFGCNNIAAGGRSRGEVIATLEGALDHGISYFDTADRYSFGASERLLGEVIKGRRDRLVICSKAGHPLGLQQRLKDLLKPWARRLKRSKTGTRMVGAVRDSFDQHCFEPAYITLAIEASLRRLGTDYLDVFLLHNPPPPVIHDGAVFAAVRRAKQRGLIRHYGVSIPQVVLHQEDVLKRLLADPQIGVLQTRLNVHYHAAATKLLAEAAAKGIAGIAFEPLGKGDLMDDPAFRDALSAHPQRTAAQTALRFAMAQPGVSVVLVGTTQRSHLEENLATLDTPALTPDELRHLTSLA
jgi:aryl-alcohol dehydrogenase-like predicted oxidoreductase